MKTVVFDIETEPFPDSGRVRTSFPCPQPVLIGLYCGQNHTLISWDNPLEVHRVFSQPNTQYVAFNAKFDLRILRDFYGIDVDKLNVLDAQVLYRLRYPLRDRLSNLAAAHNHLFPSRPLLEKGGVQLSFNRHTPPTETQIDYLNQDLTATWDIFHALHQMPLGELCRPDATYHVRAAPLAARPDPDHLYSRASALLAGHLEPRGLAIDPVALAGHNERLTLEARGLNATLAAAGLAELRRSPKAKALPTEYRQDGVGQKWAPATDGTRLIRLHKKLGWQECTGQWSLKVRPLRELFSSEARRLKLTPPLSLRTRRLSLGEDFWKEYSAQLSAPAQTFLKLVRAKKYLSAFVRPLVEAKAARVYPSYWIPGAETGRWATSSPCIHQVPRTLKDIYVPKIGNSFYSCDYKSLELYTLAQSMYCLGIDGALRATLNSGQDVHGRTAATMYGCPVADVDLDMRQAAKACNFGLPGGMGPAKFRTYLHGLGLHLDLPDVRDLINRWFRTYPDVRLFLNLFNIPSPFVLKPEGLSAREWLEVLGFDVDNSWPSQRDIIHKIRDGAVYSVTLPGGRVIHQRNYSAAANCFMQGPGADIISQAFINCCDAGLDVAAVVHDSIVVEGPAGQSKIGDTLTACMLSGLAVFCPDLTLPKLSFKETPHL